MFYYLRPQQNTRDVLKTTQGKLNNWVTLIYLSIICEYCIWNVLKYLFSIFLQLTYPPSCQSMKVKYKNIPKKANLVYLIIIADIYNVRIFLQNVQQSSQISLSCILRTLRLSFSNKKLPGEGVILPLRGPLHQYFFWYRHPKEALKQKLFLVDNRILISCIIN